MLEKFRNKVEEIDKIENKNIEPVKIEDIEKVIKIVEVAKEIGCNFKLYLKLKIDEFVVDSSSFNGIKIVKNKKEKDKILIQYENMIFSSDTYIDLDNIVKVVVECKYLCGGGISEIKD